MLYLLSPYYWGVWTKRRFTRSVKVGKTLSVGNIEMGGTGKTPLVVKIAEYLKNKGYSPVILSRGYRRKIKKPCITTNTLSAKECGDEPYMMFKRTNVLVYVNRKREEVIKEIKPERNTVFLLDDGFQYFRLKRDADIALITDKLYKNGGHVFPFGRLREPLPALRRADIVIVNFRFNQPENVKEFMGRPAFSAYYEIKGIYNKEGEKVPAKDIKEAVLLSAIAKNREFKDIIEKRGIRVIKHHSFLDHTFFKEGFLKELSKETAPIITTEKDFYRIPEAYREKFLYLRIDLTIINEEDFFRQVSEKLNRQS